MAKARNLRRSPRWLVAIAALAATASVACGGGPAGPSALPTPVASPTPTPAPPRVALVSIDGLRPDALTPERTPNILALADRGAYAVAAQTIFPSATLPGHTSMLTGVEPSVHGVTFDDYRETFQLTTPTVLSLAHNAGKHTVMVVGKNKLKQLAVAGTLDSFVLATRGDDDVVNEAIALVPAGFDLLVVLLPQTDQTGHASGWMSPEYLAQVQQTDAAVGRLVSVLPPETTILVTADHGGQLKGHGTKDKLDMTIPWIIAGPRIVHRGAAQPAGPHAGHGAHRPDPARRPAAVELHRQARERGLRAAVNGRGYTPANHAPGTGSRSGSGRRRDPPRRGAAPDRRRRLRAAAPVAPVAGGSRGGRRLHAGARARAVPGQGRRVAARARAALRPHRGGVLCADGPRAGVPPRAQRKAADGSEREPKPGPRSESTRSTWCAGW